MSCDFDDDIQAVELSREETIALAQECLDGLPHDPRFFTTSVAVQDLEALRLTLGYGPLNLYGVSYGSRVAQHYARRYPASTRSVILDGVVPPQLALGPDIAIEAQNALRAIFERCAEDPACDEAFPEIAVTFNELSQRLAADAIPVTLPHPGSGRPHTVSFSDKELASAIRLMSYTPGSAALIPLLVQEAAQGNLAPLAASFLRTTESLSEQFATGMHNAVVCTEDTPFIDDFDVEALGSTYIGPLLIESLDAVCSIWPRGILDDDLRSPLKTEAPVLLLSGSADPITPPAYAERAAVDLGNARHLIGKDQGHGLAGRGCMPEIIGRFVTTASVDELETECMERLFAMPFFLDFSGPAP